MKQLILFIFLFFNPVITFPDKNYADNTSKLISGIEDGWYKATVIYFNYSTYTRSTYTLNVEVEYDRVITIDFGNEGSVHTGYNNSGYIYSGGYLSYERDFNNNIVAATTRVSLYTKSGSTVTFDITIE